MEKSHDDEFTGSSQDSNELPLNRDLVQLFPILDFTDLSKIDQYCELPQWPEPVDEKNAITPEVTLVIVDSQLYDRLHEIITRYDDHKIQPAEDATSVD